MAPSERRKNTPEAFHRQSPGFADKSANPGLWRLNPFRGILTTELPPAPTIQFVDALVIAYTVDQRWPSPRPLRYNLEMSEAHAKFGWRGWVALLGIYTTSFFVVGSIGGLQDP
jgi:hypothetical protein